jgi:peroxiredoxin
MKRNFHITVTIMLLSAAIGVYFGIQHRGVEPPTDNATATLFSQKLPDAQGKLRELTQWRGKALIVNFWATWCEPCVQEMPELSDLQAEIASKNVQIIGIGVDTAHNVAQFAEKHTIAYPLYVSGMNGADLSRQFGNQAGGLPFTILITPGGRVKKTYLGRLKLDELRKDLRSL